MRRPRSRARARTGRCSWSFLTASRTTLISTKGPMGSRTHGRRSQKHATRESTSAASRSIGRRPGTRTGSLGRWASRGCRARIGCQWCLSRCCAVISVGESAGPKWATGSAADRLRVGMFCRVAGICAPQALQGRATAAPISRTTSAISNGFVMTVMPTQGGACGSCRDVVNLTNLHPGAASRSSSTSTVGLLS